MHESTVSPGSATQLRVGAALAAVYVIWGSTYLAIRIGIETVPPFTLAGVRFVVAGAILYAWLLWRGEPKPDRSHWLPATIVGALMLLGGNGGVCWAEQRVPSGLTALIIGTTPLWMVLIDWIWHGAARPTARTALGLVCGFTGVGLLISPGQFAGGGGVDPAGAAVLVLATICWAVGSLYSRGATLPRSPLMATAIEMLMGGLVLCVAAGIAGEWTRVEIASVSARSLNALIYLIVFGSLIAFSAYIWLLRVTRTAVVATYAYVNPLVAVFLGWAFAGEPVTLRTVLAAAAIIAAVMVIIDRRPQTSTTS